MAKTNQPEYARAALSTFDGSISYSFLIQPERIRYSPRAVFSSLPVLNTAQPLVKYKYSEQAIVIPEAKLWTDTGLVSIKPQLDQLVAWTMPDPAQAVPKLLKFSWGTEVIPRCYLVGFPYQVTARMAPNTEPSMAVGDLELLIAPEPPEAVRERPKKLTAREIEVNQRKVDSRLERTPGLRETLGLREGEQPTVREDGKVVVKRGDREIVLGTLEAILEEETSRTLREPR